MRTLSLVATLALTLPAAAALGDEPRPNDSTLGQKPPADAVVLFGGRNLDGWVKRNSTHLAGWPVEDGVVTVGKGQGDIMTAKKFGDFQLHLEFNVPYMPDAHGQGRGNSGVYLDGLYELQVLDSYGLKSKNNDCGAIYSQVAPQVNACKPPLQWQTYDVTFHKATVEDGKVVKKARVTVMQNGVTIIDDAKVSPTPGADGVKEGGDGPLLLQDHGNEVQYRNIWVRPLD